MNFSKSLERNSNYLYGHGSYISDYQDEQGRIFTTIMQVSEETASELLAEAMCGMNDDIFAGEDRRGHTRMSTHYNFQYQSWMNVSNKDFICFKMASDFSDTIMALYRHDFKVYLVSADVKRLQNHEVRVGFPLSAPFQAVEWTVTT